MDEFRVILAPSVIEKLATLTNRDDQHRVRKRLLALATVPHFGMVYDPIYDAARPDHEVLVTYAGHIGIYYTCDDANRTVCIEYVEDTRRDPLGRFGD